MKKVLPFIFVLCFLLSCNDSKNNNSRNMFYEKIANDTRRYSYFVVIQCSLDNDVNDYVIENNNLRLYIEDCMSLSSSEHISNFIINKLLISRDTISIKNSDIKEYDFREVKFIQSIDEDFRDTNLFPNKYFINEICINTDVLTVEEANYVIYKLFDREIEVYRDCESGYFVFEKH